MDKSASVISNRISADSSATCNGSALPEIGPTQIQHLTLECGDSVTIASERGNPFADCTFGTGEGKITATLTAGDAMLLWSAIVRGTIGGAT